MATLIYVFDSDVSGKHLQGAALYAMKYRGAIYGQGAGRQGDSYGLPVKTPARRFLPIPAIRTRVNTFLAYAAANPSLTFDVCRIAVYPHGGQALPAYSDEVIAPLFAGAPANCELPYGWRAINGEA